MCPPKGMFGYDIADLIYVSVVFVICYIICITKEIKKNKTKEK